MLLSNIFSSYKIIIELNINNLLNKNIFEVEKKLKSIFGLANKLTPSILYIENIDLINIDNVFYILL